VHLLIPSLFPDIIDSWEDYEELEELPEDKLCSFCFGGKLRMMQESPYSAYDDLYAGMLEHINQSKINV
jgi:hypothetical protein